MADWDFSRRLGSFSCSLSTSHALPLTEASKRHDRMQCYTTRTEKKKKKKAENEHETYHQRTNKNTTQRDVNSDVKAIRSNTSTITTTSTQTIKNKQQQNTQNNRTTKHKGTTRRLAHSHTHRSFGVVMSERVKRRHERVFKQINAEPRILHVVKHTTRGRATDEHGDRIAVVFDLRRAQLDHADLCRIRPRLREFARAQIV